MGESLPSVDPAVIASLRDLEGPDDPRFFADLVEQFVKHADGAVPRIRAAVAARDAKTVEDVAHGLKGSSGNMGAKRMHRLCSDLQRAGTSRALDQAAATADDLASEYATVRARLLEEAARGSAAPPADRT